MALSVKIPTPLRSLTNDVDRVESDGDTVAALVESLEAAFPGMKERLCEDSGELRRFVNVYVNGEDVRFLDGIATALGENDEISIVPAVAGG
ncbi:MAG TPA: ubiquitin-like small modifier protein 1 [Dehalococcoidia bacterium]|jgi:molybdopterin synthase sulfur carrier subunit|nr:ubiquitin-like small modifier protein 1 [Dehalococcoidia bacterium]